MPSEAEPHTFRLLTAAAWDGGISGSKCKTVVVHLAVGMREAGQPAGLGSAPPPQQQLSKQRTGETLPVCCLC